MSQEISRARRRLLHGLLAAACGSPLAARQAFAASALLRVDAPEARAVKYVEDAKDAPGAGPGNRCANCALYQGPEGSARGPCQLFPGREVKAAGWCSSWAPQL